MTDPIRALVDEQAADEGLWFIAETAPEAYLQQGLRRLHDAIEAAPPSSDLQVERLARALQHTEDVEEITPPAWVVSGDSWQGWLTQRAEAILAALREGETPGLTYLDRLTVSRDPAALRAEAALPVPAPDPDDLRETPPCVFCGHREHLNDICEQDLGEHGECQCADTRQRPTERPVVATRCVCSHKWTDHTTWCDSSGCPCRFTTHEAEAALPVPALDPFLLERALINTGRLVSDGIHVGPLVRTWGDPVEVVAEYHRLAALREGETT